MRTLLIILFLIPYCLLGLIPVPVLAILYLFSHRLPRVYACRYICFGCRALTFLSGADLSVSGTENIPDTPVYFVLNHRSLFDIIFTYPYLNLPAGFVAKDNLARVPLLAQWMRVGYSLFLDRNDIRKGLKTINHAVDYLKDGISMAIFPEGTRNKTDDPKDLLEFHSGSFRPAKKTGLPIVPVAIWYKDADCFERHLPWVRKGTVKVLFGEPIRSERLEEKERRTISAYTQNIIRQMLESCEQ